MEFEPGVNVIVGKTDSGKSSCLRALRWLSINRPGGDGFIPWDQDNAKVTLEVDGRVIVRRKGNKGNLYFLDGRKFAAFGNEVPEDIASILNVSFLNFQNQHSPHYLFSLSAPAVAKALNEVVALDAIDRTLANLSSGLRKAKTTTEVIQDRLESLQEKRKRLAWAKQADGDLRWIEEQHAKILRVKETASRIENLLRDGVRAKENIDDSTEAVLCVVKTMRGLDGGMRRLVDMNKKCIDLEKLLAALEKERGIIRQTRKEVIAAKKELKRKIKGKYCPICEKPVVKNLWE